MATGSPMETDGVPGLSEFSTSTDRVYHDDVDARNVPRGRVAPPDPTPGEDQGKSKDKGKKKHEPVDRPMDSAILADPRGTRFSDEGHPAFPKPEKKKSRLLRRIVTIAIVAVILAVGLYFTIREIHWLLITTSTDDAFVSGHTTNVSPRIDGVVTEVMVERNDRVEPGTVLVRIDREPFEIAVAQSEASLTQARSNLDLSKAQVRAQLATARGAFFQRKNLQETLRSRIKSLDAEVATLRSSQSSQKLAALDQRRLENLVKQGSATQSELDQRNNTLDLANQRVKESWTQIDETRAALGIGPNYDNPLDVPKDLVEQQSAIQNAVSTISSSLAQIGIPFDAHDIKPEEAFEQIIHMDSSRGLEEAFGRIIDQAPAVKVAIASAVRSERDLDNARLQLSWTEIKAEVAGYIQDRQANPGNRVEPGQTLVSIRPDYVWIDANYKETQLHNIKIGMPVELHVDAYPGRIFKGRVSGFSAGTGLSESLLPPENATGNYIKVTQRLPVRIELVEPNPQDTPLFIGLSVVPYVMIQQEPTGQDAGKRLHPSDRYRQHPDAGGGPAGEQLRNRVEFEAREAGHK